MLGQLFEEGGNNDNGGGGGIGVPRGVVGGMGGMGGVGVSIYKAEFEDVFLVESREFYEREAGRLLGECDAPEYLRRVGFFSRESACFFPLPGLTLSFFRNVRSNVGLKKNNPVVYTTYTLRPTYR